MIISALLFISCTAQPNQDYEKVNDPNIIANPSTEVEVIPAMSRSLNYLINGNGKVVAASQAEIIPQVSKTVSRLFYKNGDKVKVGTVIAQLEDSDEQIKVKKAKVAWEESELEFQNQLLSYQGGDLNAQVPEQILKNLKTSSGLNRAVLNYEEAVLQLKKTRIIAPISGTLANLQLSPGSVAEAGKSAAFIYDPKSLIVETELLEVDYHSLELGLNAIVNPVGKPTKSYKATVLEINPLIDQNTGLVQVKLQIIAYNGLIPGMNVTHQIKIPATPQIIVPKEAVIIRSGREVVFTLDEGLAKWHYVTTGKDNGQEIEILEGIKTGDQVIYANNLQLSHDAPVQVPENYQTL